ncbi:MAG: hypothetical protein HDT10_01600 [Helicobacter sp.]|nr:hypothetical protein [Helicobacter sp.]
MIPYKVHYYGLPQPLTRLRNNKVTDTLIPRHCEQSEAIYNLTYIAHYYTRHCERC